MAVRKSRPVSTKFDQEANEIYRQKLEAVSAEIRKKVEDTAIREVMTVSVRFQPGAYPKNSDNNHYHYFWDGDVPKSGDYAVVRVNQFEIKIVKVSSVFRGLSPKANKWLVTVLDLEAHEKRENLEAERQNLIAQLERRLVKQSRLERYRELAKDDPEALDLLDRLLRLG